MTPAQRTQRVRPERFISVDVETAGPTPGDYAMISIGACLVDEPDRGFYVELKPDRDAVIPSALAVSGLDMAQLTANGTDPRQAMEEFAQWIRDVVPPQTHRAVFVGFNAVFDWMFVNEYFVRYAIENPFGHGGLDIKSYYVGMMGSTWEQTSMKHLSPKYLDGRPLSHNALGDARDQAELFRAISADAAALRAASTHAEEAS
ncbi:3'-5' exonuclease [Pseudolysinimonas sp.]|uniref:3'-5' exonuclease n=1 Tax=Pseudolysinimonas sp. TaxID=2680009 RepID=UPI00286D2E6B|nr:3'-5' exonuclease [Pseudolysinimonas sp.]